MRRQPLSAEQVAAICDRVAAETRFSGVARVDLADGTTVARAYGLADRRWNVPYSVDTVSSIASGTKGFTALAVEASVVAGTLDHRTTARSLLGDDLPLIDDAVTVEHLLA